MQPIARIVALALAIVIPPANASGHAVVFPQTSTPGAYERYVLRVPNERDAATTRIELRFSASTRVVSFGDVPGWTLSVVRDSSQRIVAAVWTGILPPERFVELPFVAVNPPTTARLQWPAFQTYADGERVEWIGPDGSDRPASFTTVVAVGAPSAPPDQTALWVALVALAAAIVSLVRPLARRA